MGPPSTLYKISIIQKYIATLTILHIILENVEPFASPVNDYFSSMQSRVSFPLRVTTASLSKLIFETTDVELLMALRVTG